MVGWLVSWQAECFVAFQSRLNFTPDLTKIDHPLSSFIGSPEEVTFDGSKISSRNSRSIFSPDQTSLWTDSSGLGNPSNDQICCPESGWN